MSWSVRQLTAGGRQQFSLTTHPDRLAALCLIVGVSLAACQRSGRPTPTRAAAVTPLPSVLPVSPLPRPTSGLPAETDPSPTRRAAPSPTRTATPTRLFESDSLHVAPACSPAGQYLRCEDPLLRIRFEYPAEWGSLTGTLRPGETGYAYDYVFQSSDPVRGLEAGGRSRDFTEGRGGTLTDFGGLVPGAPDCPAVYRGLVCEPVQPGVILLFTFPTSDEICQPGPTSLFQPLGTVLIDLPGNPAVNGFLWAAPFLSAQLSAGLNELLGFTPEQVLAVKCGEQDRANYTRRVEQIAAAIAARSLDAETNAAVDQLYHLARSVVFE